MSIGSEELIIDGAEFVKGMSSSESLSDGGFSPETDAVNLIARAGAIYGPANATDKSTNLTGQMIASCEDPTGNYNRIYVSADTDNDGRIYQGNSIGDLTAIGSEDTTQNYVQGKTDMIPYKSEVYITTDTGIVRLHSIGSGNTVVTNFYTTSWSAFAYHPALVYEDNAYYGNGNILLRQTAAAGAPSAILTLPAGFAIIALGIDQGSGKMVISYVNAAIGNGDGTLPAQAKVGFYDGFSNKLSRTVIVEEMITAFPNCNGILYAAYGQNLGYWNGAGVSFLNRFNDIGFANTDLLYKHHFAAVSNTLYFIVDSKIVAHGPVRKMGDKVFYPAFKNSANLTHICSIGSNNLAFSYATSTFKTWSTTSISSNSSGTAFITNPLRFPRSVYIRSVTFEYVTLATGTAPFTLYYRNGSVLGPQFVSYTVSSNPLSNASGSTIQETQVPAVGILSDRGRVFSFKLSRDESNVNIGVTRIIILYDWAD